MSVWLLYLLSDSLSQGIFIGVRNMCSGIVCVLLHATRRRCSNHVATCFTMTIKHILILIPAAKDGDWHRYKKKSATNYSSTARHGLQGSHSQRRELCVELDEATDVGVGCRALHVNKAAATCWLCPVEMIFLSVCLFKLCTPRAAQTK